MLGKYIVFEGMSRLKILSKENLIWGGVYTAIDIPFFYTNLYKVSECLFFIFFLGFILQCFCGTIFNLEKKIISYRKISYYLISIGWIPYFYIGLCIFYFILIFLSMENVYVFVDDMLSYFSQITIPLSLMIAFIRDK